MLKILNIFFIFFKKEISSLFLILKNKEVKENFNKKYDFFQRYLTKEKTNQKILVTTFLNIYDYLKYEYLLGVYLSKIINKKIIFLVNKKDNSALSFLKKIGINKEELIFFDEGNFFKRLKYLIQSYKLLSKIKTIDDFVEFKYRNIELGKIIYSHHARYVGLSSSDKILDDYFIYGAFFINYYNQFEKILEEHNITEVIQSETQFMPNSVMFGLSLEKRIEVFSRTGINEITVKKAKDPALFCESRQQFDPNVHHRLKKCTNREEMIRRAKEILTLRFEGKLKADIDIDDQLMKLIDYQKNTKVVQKSLNKNEFCKLMRWNNEKPIGAILANDLTDAMFTNKWRIYRDNYIWLRETIKLASSNKKMNWIVKPHPSEIKNKVTLTTPNLLKDFGNFDNIKLYPSEVSLKCLPNIVDVIVTNFGSAGYEYPALGVPAITSSESMYSEMNVSIEAKTEEEYKKLILECPNIKPVDKDQRENALLFTYLLSVLTKITISTVADNDNPYSIVRDQFWKQFEKSFKFFEDKNNGLIENDLFYRSFKYQMDKDLKHTLHLDEIKKLDIKF